MPSRQVTGVAKFGKQTFYSLRCKCSRVARKNWDESKIGLTPIFARPESSLATQRFVRDPTKGYKCLKQCTVFFADACLGTCAQ